MATKTRNPTSEVSITGTWSGTSRHLIVDDYPDSANPAADVTTCSAVGEALFGFTAFDVPAGSTSISVQGLYYDFKNGSAASAISARIRCNDTTGRDVATHNPSNGNANIASRSDNYATNPKSGAAWTVDDVNGVGTNGLTAFGVRVSDASPSVALSSVQLQVTYTPPITGDLSKTLGAITVGSAGKVIIDGDLSKTLGAVSLSAAGTVANAPVTGSLSKTLEAVTLSAVGDVDIAGALSQTLGAVTISAVGDVDVAGSLSNTLGAITVSADGTVADSPGEGIHEGDEVAVGIAGGIECSVFHDSGVAVRVTQGGTGVVIVQSGGTPIKVVI